MQRKFSQKIWQIYLDFLEQLIACHSGHAVVGYYQIHLRNLQEKSANIYHLSSSRKKENRLKREMENFFHKINWLGGRE